MARDDESFAYLAFAREAATGWSSIADRFGARAAETPDAVAVESGFDRLTYAELAIRADRFARRLAAERPSVGDFLVALCLDRSVDLPAWLLAVFRAGGAYVPIDPTIPAGRIAQILDGAEPTLVVASESLVDRLPPLACPLILAGAIGDRTASLPAAAGAPDRLAYVMYTSGSTGQPKGVEIEHRGIVALLCAIADRPGLARGQTLLAPTRLSFDLSVIDLLLPLIVGARTVILALEAVTDPYRLATAIARVRPDFMQATPATWRSLLDAGWNGLPTMTLLCGGEAMTRDLAERLLPRCASLWNVYGPTETTVWSAAHRIETGIGPVAIGRAIEGSTIGVLDEQLQALPPGEVGEIVIGGAGVARGYRGQPALTAERFVATADGRGYRTGDLGRVSEDGLLHCLGRKDDQVKVRGFRLELGDVEGALSSHPDVAWAAARTWPDASGEVMLAAYVVPRGGGALPARLLRDFLAERLPPYMVPDRFVTLPEMPLNANRKVDRRALPDPRGIAVTVAAPALEVENPIEARLRVIWRELLGAATIARDDDFFDLGGYSLITIRLLRRIEAEFGRLLDMSDLMRASTLSAMAALIAADPVAHGGGAAMLLTDGGAAPPLHWLDAGPLVRRLLRAAAADRRVYGLNLSAAEETALGSGALDVAAVAAAVGRRLVALQPTGPYYLGGWCRWGIVAQELARQLVACGETVALLVLLDAVVPPPGLVRLLSNMAWHKARGDAAGGNDEDLSFSQRVEQAAARHRPGRLRADLLVLRARSTRARAGSGGWSRRTDGDVAVFFSEGDHEAMVREPHVHALARRIAEELHRKAPAL